MKILVSFAFIIAFCVIGFAQTIPSKSGKELKEIEKQIVTVENQIKETQAAKALLLTKYSEDYSEVKKQDVVIATLNTSLDALKSQKQRLLKTKLVDELPNNNVDLLKMIVVQNERIIELLEKMQN